MPMVLPIDIENIYGPFRSHCDDYCGLPIGNLAPDTVDPRVVRMSAIGTKRTWHRGGLISAFGGKATTHFATGLGVLGLLGWRRKLAV